MEQLRDLVNDMERIVGFVGAERDEDKKLIPNHLEENDIEEIKGSERALGGDQTVIFVEMYNVDIRVPVSSINVSLLEYIIISGLNSCSFFFSVSECIVGAVIATYIPSSSLPPHLGVILSHIYPAFSPAIRCCCVVLLLHDCM